ncbi:M48 family metalloprotease [Halomonas sp. E14]|uniref:M48 family metalloprotease n=1 Tax=Halomonas sp. E14 TaxID=3397245 RepID=UPI00403E8713
MDFFGAQAQARRLTLRLIVLLVIAIVGMVAAATLVITLALALFNESAPPGTVASPLFDPLLLASVTVAVVMVVGLGSLVRHRQLRAGGGAVAEALGGRLVNATSQNADEQRLLNVVEEMALASGMPVPAVYVLDEPAINAFAAGHAAHDAAIGVTRGALQQLDRDQLQGVIAHEFSHILHGDMRLNMRLVALLHGILLIGLAGRLLLHGASGSRRVRAGNRQGNGHVVLLGAGLALMAIGFIGTLCGNWIKAAVSRQREFLADASAVQYTRNPAGIAGALKQLAAHAGGSELRAARASEFSHFYFGRGVRGLRGLTATHPPLAMRIRRIEPEWDGTLPPPQRTPGDEAPAGPATRDSRAAGLAPPRGATVPAATNAEPLPERLREQIGRLGEEDIGQARQVLAALDARLLAAAHDPYAARALVYGILMGVDPASRERQRQALLDQALPEVLAELDRLGAALETLDAGQRLPLIELALPVLRQLSTTQYARFRACLASLMAQERQPGALQWSLHRLVMAGIEGQRGARVRGDRLADQEAAVACLLSSLAGAGDTSREQALAAYGEAVAVLPTAPAMLEQPATPAELDRALAGCQRLAVEQRALLIEAMGRCVTHDGRVTAAEAELLRAVAWSLGCPLPLTAAGLRPAAGWAAAR